MTDRAPLLLISHLSISYDDTEVVRDVSLVVDEGHRLAVVGESGSGKSTLVQAVLGLLPDNARVTSGEIRFRGERIDDATEERLRELRGRHIGLVPQDPLTNLDPLGRIDRQLAEGPRAHARLSRRTAEAEVVDVLRRVRLPEPERNARQYPHQLSGGMRQRTLIGMGIASGPSLLLADEPTSALDVTVQRGILDLIDSLVDESRLGLLFVTHDLALAAERSSHLLVMRHGEVVEHGPSAELVTSPRAEYTRELVDAAPHRRARPYGDPVESSSAPQLLDVGGLEKSFGRRQPTRAVDGVSFSIARGETLALVGESGSGKSTIANIVLGFETPDAGTVTFDGVDITGFATREAAARRRLIQPVFQDPGSSLNPRFTAAEAIAEPLRIARSGDAAARLRRVDELLEAVALPKALAGRNVRQLSGGQKQRVAIARALALNPALLICDEAVSALDVLVQEQILELLGELQREFHVACLFITHNLSVARWIAHRVIVLQKGAVVEQGDVAAVFDAPRHPYTRELLAAIPGRAA